jgi:hypothetical protein
MADGEGNQSGKTENSADKNLKKVAPEGENGSGGDGEAKSQDREAEISEGKEQTENV